MQHSIYHQAEPKQLAKLMKAIKMLILAGKRFDCYPEPSCKATVLRQDD